MPIHVNDATITDAELDAELERARAAIEREGGPDAKPVDLTRLRTLCRDHLIGRKLLEQAGATLPPAAGEPDADSPEARLRRAVRHFSADVPEPDAEAVRAYYDAHTDAFQTPEQVHASHIVKHANQGGTGTDAYRELLNARAAIERGESFADVAGRVSDCPDRGGDLGTFGRGQMVEAFDNVVFALEPGQVSDVFQTAFGHHIAIVHKRHPPGRMPFEQMDPHIRRMLQDQARHAAVEAAVERLRGEADIRDEDAAG